MKTINEPKIGGAVPMSGCTCSYGYKDTKGKISHWFRCNCQCSYGINNQIANKNKSDAK